MNPFFRRIRHQLANDNQFLKYSRYAIGEIALVVVGILIALQINDWNENRKTTTHEIKILKELKNDLESNLNEIKETYNTTKNRQLSTVLILDYFRKALPVDDSLKRAFENINMDGLFNIANTTYKFIENQGINTLSNDSLRVRVTEMYERHLKNIHTRETANWSIINQELLPLMNDYFIASPTIDKGLSFAVEAINTPKNISFLRKDHRFKNVIIRLQNWLLVRLNWQQEAFTTLEQLIIDVEKDIDRLGN